MFFKERFSERLKSLRTGKGIKQSELAAIVGIRNTSISMMESGERGPSAEVLCALADFFDVALDYLAGRSDDAKGGDRMGYADVSALKSVSQEAAGKFLSFGWVVVAATYNTGSAASEAGWTLLIGWPRENGEPIEH